MEKRRIIIAVYLAIALVAVLAGLYIHRMFTRNAVEAMAQNKKMINILIEGSNVYHDNRHSFYAILSINPDNSRVGMTFIPPNFRVTLDGYGKRFKRIDEIDIDNFSRISRYLRRDLKLHVPFYVELYAVDVERMVDLLDGIDVFILNQLQSISGAAPGLNYFDGRKIVQYINDVEGNSIYKKYDRIQDVILSLYTGRERYTKFTGAKFVSELSHGINTNLLEKEMMSLMKYLFKDAELYFTLIPGTVNEEGYFVTDDVAYKIYEEEFLARLILNEKDEPSIKIRILNGTDVPGLARKMRNILIKEGLNVVEFGTSPYPGMDETVIVNQKGELAGVRKVSEILGVNRIYHVVDSSQLNNALIIIGKDYLK